MCRALETAALIIVGKKVNLVSGTAEVAGKIKYPASLF